jgi:hypothetical protein
MGTMYATNSPSHFSAYAQVAPSSRTHSSSRVSTRSPAPWTQPALGISSAERQAAHGTQGAQHTTATEHKHAGGSKQQQVSPLQKWLRVQIAASSVLMASRPLRASSLRFGLLAHFCNGLLAMPVRFSAAA